MKLAKLFCIVVSLTVFGFRASAQTLASPTPRPTPPSEPLMNQAPDFAAWTIVRQSIPGLGGQSADAVVQAVATANKPDSVTNVTKTGPVRLEALTRSDAPKGATGVTKRGPVRHQATITKARAQEDVWYEHGNRIVVESTWKMPMFERAVNPANQPAGTDFPEFAWITPKNFVGTQAVGETTYFVFEGDTTEGDAGAAKTFGNKLKTTHNRAFVNADTRLPWLLQNDDVLLRYAFQAAPTAALDVPPEYQALFDTFETKKAAAAQKPVAP